MLILLKQHLVVSRMHTKLTVQQCATRGKAANQATTKGEDTLCNKCLDGSFHTIQK